MKGYLGQLMVKWRRPNKIDSVETSNPPAYDPHPPFSSPTPLALALRPMPPTPRPLFAHSSTPSWGVRPAPNPSRHRRDIICRTAPLPFLAPCRPPVRRSDRRRPSEPRSQSSERDFTEEEGVGEQGSGVAPSLDQEPAGAGTGVRPCKRAPP